MQVYRIFIVLTLPGGHVVGDINGAVERVQGSLNIADLLGRKRGYQ